jgi:pimeloyl-ACP methyl ester carboxylesterase
VFSETRYAKNGDLRVAYRTSREGPRDIVFVPNWFTCCEHLPELPSFQGWIEAMTSLGRLIFFDQPGTGASDPVSPGALLTLKQWADSITAVLDDLGSREAVLLAVDGAFAPAALFAATYPFRTTALVALEGHADNRRNATDGDPRRGASVGHSGARAGLHTGECEARGEDIGGIAVRIGARVAALAGVDDVLVSSTPLDLVIGSGVEFEDRGAHVFSGVPGQWSLFAVAST